MSPEASERAGEGANGGMVSREKKELGCEVERECIGADVNGFGGVGGKPGLLLLTLFMALGCSGGKALAVEKL